MLSNLLKVVWPGDGRARSQFQQPGCIPSVSSEPAQAEPETLNRVLCL